MPAKHFILDKRIKNQLLKIPLPIHKKIIHTLKVIAENPISGVKLHGELQNYYKFRVGDYRIVYSFNAKQNKVEVVKIEHRQGVYR